MGILGSELGSEIGSGLGSFVGNRFKHKKEGERIGRVVGKIAGSYLPFEKGGLVKPPKGHKKQIIVAHKGELIVPKNMVKHVSKSLKNKIKRHGGRNMC
jgi:hypothetical protein